MKLSMIWLSSIFLILFLDSGSCQIVEKEMVEYEFGYPFKTGIYYTFENFKENSTIEINYFHVITIASEAACRNGRLSDYIKYESGSETIKIKGEDIWGYSKKGDVYVSHRNMFYKIFKYGSICYLVALRGNTREDDEIQKHFNAATSEHHALLDANTGKTYDFKTKYLDSLLVKDEELYEEYLNSNIKKRDKDYLFIRKFNEQHKIYFPVVNE